MSKDVHPRVSIAIPIHNEELYIRETINSIINQTFTDWHAYILENCSNDNTLRILNEFTVKYPHKFTIIPTENLIDSASNFYRAFRLNTQSEYFCWIGGHDAWNTKFLETSVLYLDQNESISLCYPRGVWVNTNGAFLQNIPGFFDTRGLSVKARIFTVLNSTPYAFQIYGLHRRSSLWECWDQINLTNKVAGPDVILLCAIASRGDIVGFDFTESSIKMRICDDYGDWSSYFNKLGLTNLDSDQVLWNTIKAFFDAINNKKGSFDFNDALFVSERLIWCLNSFMPSLAKSNTLHDNDVMRILNSLANLTNECHSKINSLDKLL